MVKLQVPAVERAFLTCAPGDTRTALVIIEPGSLFLLYSSPFSHTLFYSIPQPYKVVGAPQMISQQPLFILSCFQLS